MRFEQFSPDNLKKIRKEFGYNSQREFSVASGIPESTIKKIEAGLSEPSIKTLGELGRFFQIYFYIGWSSL